MTSNQTRRPKILTSDLRIRSGLPLPLPELDVRFRCRLGLRPLRLEHGPPEKLDHAGALPYEEAGNQEQEDDGQSDGDVGSRRHFGALSDGVFLVVVFCW